MAGNFLPFSLFTSLDMLLKLEKLIQCYYFMELNTSLFIQVDKWLVVIVNKNTTWYQIFQKGGCYKGTVLDRKWRRKVKNKYHRRHCCRKLWFLCKNCCGRRGRPRTLNQNVGVYSLSKLLIAVPVIQSKFVLEFNEFRTAISVVRNSVKMLCDSLSPTGNANKLRRREELICLTR